MLKRSIQIGAATVAIMLGLIVVFQKNWASQINVDVFHEINIGDSRKAVEAIIGKGDVCGFAQQIHPERDQRALIYQVRAMSIVLWYDCNDIVQLKEIYFEIRPPRPWYKKVLAWFN